MSDITSSCPVLLAGFVLFAPAYLFKVVVFVTVVALCAKGWAFLPPDSCRGIAPKPLSPTVCAGFLVLDQSFLLLPVGASYYCIHRLG